jgi:hypothetical protein
VAGAPRDALWKSGAGGYSLYVVPSLDLVIPKWVEMNVNTIRHSPAYLCCTSTMIREMTGNRPPGGVDSGVRRLLEMVVAAVNR